MAESLAAEARRQQYVAEWIADYNSWFAESLAPTSPRDERWRMEMCARKATLLGRAAWLLESEDGRG